MQYLIQGVLFIKESTSGPRQFMGKRKVSKLTFYSLDIKNIKCNYIAIPRLQAEWFLTPHDF